MEYYENTGGAVAQLRWTGPGISQVAIPGTALTTSRANTWEIALANGTYPVAIVCGDPLSLAQANHLLVEGTALTDLDPGYDWTVPGYQAGDFDGYLVSATVADGKLTIAAGMEAFDPKICFVEIGPAGTAAEVQAMLTAATPTMTSLIAEATGRTWETAPAVDGVREFVYGSYVDEVVAYTQKVGSVTTRYYPHYNHLYSVAALTDAAGVVVERFQYDSYGKQKITDATGNVTRAKSAVGWDRGFTGYILEGETGLNYARARMYSPTLGRFIGRDTNRSVKTRTWTPSSGDGYQDGLSLYAAYFTPNSIDPSGMGNLDTGYGQLVWSIYAATGKGRGLDWEYKKGSSPTKHGAVVSVHGDFAFIPDKCCCKVISFINVVTKDDRGSGKPEVDILEGETDPYYGAEMGPDGKWREETIGGKPARGAFGGAWSLGSCQPNKTAYTTDDPTTFVFNKHKEIVWEAEMCAVCIDTGKVLGCVKWGYRVPENSLEPKPIDGPASQGPSNEWKQGINDWNAKKSGFPFGTK